MNAELLQDAVTESVEKISKSVVVVRNEQIRRGMDGGLYEVSGQGSGTVISRSGYILTNYHVVENSSEITVSDQYGNEKEAVHIGDDMATDIALLRVKGSNMDFAELGESSRLKTGQMVLAVGNALGLTGGPSVSMGVVSALGRMIPRFEFILGGLIQTDAAINPGNSGGPLSDLSGNIVGINFSMIPYAQGIGFAIPIDFAKWVMQEILDHGKVIRPWLGVSAISVKNLRRRRVSAEGGVIILHVMRGSPAYDAGLREGDIITSINGKRTDEMADIVRILSGSGIGREIEIDGFRNGLRMRTSARLIPFPDSYSNRLN